MRRVYIRIIWTMIALILAAATPVFAKGKLKVFILAGQSPPVNAK
jgi:hypothetical protein